MRKNKFVKENPADKWELVGDIVKSVIAWAVVSALGFLYWMAVLLLISIFLMNIWHTNFDSILQYGIVLAVITSIVYAGILIYRKRH